MGNVSDDDPMNTTSAHGKPGIFYLKIGKLASGKSNSRATFASTINKSTYPTRRQ